MSRITNDRFNPGDSLAAGTLNSKFTDVQAASTSLNADNVRAEAIDIGNISTGTPLFIKSAAQVHHTSAATYTSAQAVTALTGSAINIGGGGLALATGDLLRVYWNLEVNGFYVTAGGANPPVIAVKMELGATCWGVWLQYASSAGPGGWTEVPGQDGYASTVTSPDGIDAENTPAFTPIPMFNYASSGPTPLSGTVGSFTTHYPPDRTKQNCSYMGAYLYKATGALTIHGLRLVTRGLFSADANTTPTPDKGILVNMDSESGYGAGDITMGLNQLLMSYMLMRTV